MNLLFSSIDVRKPFYKDPDRQVLDKVYEILVRHGIPTKKLGHLIELLLLKWIDNLEAMEK